MKKIFAIVLTVVLTASLVACSNQNNHTPVPKETWPDLDGNPYTTHRVIDGETYVDYDYSAVYDSLDLSQYKDWGSFGEDGLMWVEKSDYTGKSFGYIDYKGNVVIPFTEEIVTPGDFNCGHAIVSYERDGFGMGNGIHGIINIKGDVVFKYDNHAVSGYWRQPNGNILFNRIDPIDEVITPDNVQPGAEAYLFVGSQEKVIALPGNVVDGIDYSDGLTRVYIRYNDHTPVLPAVKFYNDDGEEILSIDNDSNEYYKSVIYVSNFNDGVAYVTFWGLSREYYRVSIDIGGKWLSEPVQIDKDDITDRFDM